MNRRPRLPALNARRIAATMLVLAVAGAGLGFALGRTQSVTWQANRHALIRVWSVDALVLSGQTADVTSNNLADAATVATSTDVLSRAALALDQNGVDRATLAATVSATASQDSDFVQISATGPSAADADARVQAVAAAFVAVVRTKVLASAAQISALTAGGATSSARAEIQVRAQAVAALDPVQIYSTAAPVRDGTSTGKAIAIGLVVGLAAGALLIVLFTFAAPRLRRPGDVANSLGLPALSWSSEETPTDEDTGIRGDLVRAAGRGAIAVCPARPEDAAAAARFGVWLAESSDGREQGPTRPRRSPFSGVVHIDSPVDGLAASRPPADAIDTAVLVTTAGSQTDVVERAADLLGQWRRMDAVILVR